MLGKFKNWLFAMPTWKASLVAVALFVVCVFLALLWLAMLFKSGWVLIGTVLAVVFWIAYAVIEEGKNA